MTIDEMIGEAVRKATATEVRSAVREEMARVRAEATCAATTADSYLSVSEAAQIAGVHEATIRSWLNQGRLPGYRAGRHRRVKRAELERFMASLSDGDSADLDARAAELAGA
jgi:excisionase family DNA binding protein